MKQEDDTVTVDDNVSICLEAAAFVSKQFNDRCQKLLGKGCKKEEIDEKLKRAILTTQYNLDRILKLLDEEDVKLCNTNPSESEPTSDFDDNEEAKNSLFRDLELMKSDDESAELEKSIKRLANFNSLESKSVANKSVQSKKSKKKDMKKNLLNISSEDDDDNSADEDSNDQVEMPSSLKIYNNNLDKNEIAKQMLLDEMTSSEISDQTITDFELSDKDRKMKVKDNNKQRHIVTIKKGKKIDPLLTCKLSQSESDVSGYQLENIKRKRRKKRRIIESDASSSSDKENFDSDCALISKHRKRKRIKQTTDLSDVDDDSDKSNVKTSGKQHTKHDAVTTKLVLHQTREELIQVDPRVVSQLKPHQVEGVKFLWETVCESIDRMQTHPGSGCILAHCMGLGKTLQVITFIHTLLTNEKQTKMKTCLIVCPLNTILNWYYEFDKWLHHDKLDVYELVKVKNNGNRAKTLNKWHRDGGVLIIGYDMFRNLVQENGKRINKEEKEIFLRTLIDPGADIVVCDEGHILKNDLTALAKAMNRIRTRRRIVLTGTPLQNNLSEYHCMVQFVKPNLLGTRKEFENHFLNPIVNGQCADSTMLDVQLMKRRAHILHNLLDGFMQRKDYSVLTQFLPPKLEYVMNIRLSETQIQLYRHFIDYRKEPGRLFADYQTLMKIWTHPYVLKYENTSFIDDSEDGFESNEWWNEMISENEMSGKIVVLLDILNACEIIGDKVLVFSQSLFTLDFIEKNLNSKWIKGLDYYRMDGSTCGGLRKRLTKDFNDSQRAKCFLISTKAGGLGINLVSANRVVVFDASWNPTHDDQSIFRVYRFGQTKPVYIYRLLANGSMEEKIYDRQITKLSLSYRVLDEQQIERHFSSADLQELYTFEPDTNYKITTPLVPKDRLLAQLLLRQKDWICGYHEHESLFENKELEELTEDERKGAWAEYEAEKKALFPAGQIDINFIVEKVQQQWPDLSQQQLNEKVDQVIVRLGQQQQMEEQLSDTT